jgi:hypothetical protein
MIRISEGPKIREYSIAIDAPVSEVLEWLNKEINNPQEWFLKEHPDPKDRRNALFGYIEWVLMYDLAEGINERIRKRIENERRSDREKTDAVKGDS